MGNFSGTLNSRIEKVVTRFCRDCDIRIEWNSEKRQFDNLDTPGKRHLCANSMKEKIDRLEKAVLDISKQNKDILYLLRTKSY